MAEQFSIPTAGDVVAGRYEILEELGRGSYGVVFRAEQLGIGRMVALKTLLPKAFLQTDIVQRFHREANLISRLQHPNVVTLFDFGQSEGGVLYMAMELIQGQPLSELIASGALPTERALHIIKQVLSALEAAHREGIVHRDLKPENIVLTTLGERQDVVKVLDFGIAKLTAGDEQEGALKTLTVQGYVLGTPHYMSPENITGDPVDHRADLYAVGIMLYELLAGVHPFDAPSPSAVLVRHLNDPPPPLPDPSQERSNVGRAIRLALAKEPEQRIGSASDFMDLLEGRLELPPEAPPRRGPGGHRLLWPLAAGGAALVLLALGITLALTWGESEGGEGSEADAGVVVDVEDASGVSREAEDAEQEAGSAAQGGAPEVDAAGDELDAALVDAARTDGGSADVGAAGADVSVERPDAGRDVGQAGADGGGAVDPGEVQVGPRGAMTRLHFVSEPSNAQVTVDGTPIGVTPCTKFVRREGGPVKVSFSQIGYKTAQVTVTPTEATQTVTVKLQRGRLKLEP